MNNTNFLHKNLKLFLILLRKNVKLFIRGGKLYQWLRLIGHTSSFTVGGETEGAQGPHGWSNLRPDRPTSHPD